MKRPLLLSALMVVPLTACQQMTPGVDVSRFYQSHVPDHGTVAVIPLPGIEAGPEFRTYAGAVEKALTASGFTVVGNSADKPEFVAQLAIRTDYRSGGPRPRPFSGVVSGSTGSYGSGVGVGININLSGKPKDVGITELTVRLATPMNSVLWEGRATTEAKSGTPAAQGDFAAARLANALFRGYPGRSGESITVK